MVTVYVTISESRSLTRPPAGDTGWRSESGSRGRRLVTSALGRLGHHACRHYDRHARCIAASGAGRRRGEPPPLIGAKSREAWPDAEPWGRIVAEVRAAVERRKACGPHPSLPRLR